MIDTLELLKKRMTGLLKTESQLQEQKIAATTIIRNIETRAELETTIDAEIETNALELEATVNAIEEIEKARSQGKE